MKDLIEIEGSPKWVKTKDSGMSFKACECHNEIRLHFALGMPFDASFSIDLRRDEALILSKQLISAAEECKDNCGEDGVGR